MTSFKVSSWPLSAWPCRSSCGSWWFLAPALPGGVVRGTRWLALSAAGLMAAGVHVHLPPCAAGRGHVHDDLRLAPYTIQVRAGGLHQLRGDGPGVGRPGVEPCRSSSSGLVRVGVLSSARLRRSRRMGYFIMAAVAVALPGVDPVTTLFEMVPLWLLFETSIWLSVLFERRWATVMADTAA